MTNSVPLTTTDLDGPILTRVAHFATRYVWSDVVFQTIEQPIRFTLREQIIQRSMWPWLSRRDHPNFGWDWYR